MTSFDTRTYLDPGYDQCAACGREYPASKVDLIAPCDRGCDGCKGQQWLVDTACDVLIDHAGAELCKCGKCGWAETYLERIYGPAWRLGLSF